MRLPSISSGDLEWMLLKDINAIFKAFAYRREDLDDKRWSGACPMLLNNRFSTIREVRRFTNALKTKLSILPRFCCFEDVVALMVLELKTPKLVDWVRTHKDFLCGTIGSSLYMNSRDPKDNLANLEEQFSGIVPSSEAEWAVEAVCRLFPRVANKTGMSHCASYSRESLSAIWRADSFDLYFHSNMPDGIDVHEVQDALNVSEGGVLLENLRRHAEAGSMIDFVSAMRTRVSTLEERRAEVVAKACLLALGLSKEKSYAPLASTSADLELIRLRYRQWFCALLGSRRHGYSLSRDASRYRREPHSLLATYFRRAATSMRADFPSGNVPTTRVRRLISLLSRSMALFVRMRRQCSRGVSQYVSVSAKPSRTTFAASFSLIDSSLAATDSALAAEVNLNLSQIR